jgi:hypothetical protein
MFLHFFNIVTPTVGVAEVAGSVAVAVAVEKKHQIDNFSPAGRRPRGTELPST